MIPNVFVSSTINDLQHLREAIRDAISELSYDPIMSEYGEVGYLPSASAEESCYITLKDCQVAVIIISKRYGSISTNDRSITHNEFSTSRELRIPVICLLDQEVLSFKQVYDLNKENKESMPQFPGMDAPERTFSFVQEIMDSPYNNGILPFSNASDARNHLKRQLAYIFGDLLRNRYDPLKADVKDVLSEIKTLRHELLKEKKVDVRPYLKATRFLIGPEGEDYARFLEHLFPDMDEAIHEIIACETFDQVLDKANMRLKIVENSLFDIKSRYEDQLIHLSQRLFEPPRPDTRADVAIVAITKDKLVLLNPTAKNMFNRQHKRLREAVGKK